MSKKCITCWQYEVCDPPKEVIPDGCEFYSPTRPTESLPLFELQTGVVFTRDETIDLLEILKNPPKPTPGLIRALSRKW